jgi:glutamyl-tRNA reductase
MRILMKGISHRTAPVELREQLSIQPGRLADAIGALLRVPGVHEALILSTCNRTELLVCHDPEGPDLSGFLAEYFGIEGALIREHTHEHHGIDAVQHLFRVACSLDSLVLGEPQILGQVKDAYTVARSVGAVRSNLEQLMQATFSVAKKVRHETRVGNAPVSVASVAIDLIRRVFGSLNGRRLLLVGAGKMSEVAAAQLMKHGAESIAVANRTYEHAVDMAARFAGRAVRFEDVHGAAAQSDIVVTSTGAPEYIFRREQGPALMQLRKNRPLFFVDIAVPRDVDPEISRIEGVFVYDIDSLQSVALSHRHNRNREAERAEMIVAQEAIRCHRLATAPNVTPMIRGLQAAIEAMAQAEQVRAQSKLRLFTPDQQRAVQQLTRGMVNRFLHPVLRSLKQASEQGDVGRIEAIRAIFDLNPLPTAQADDQTERSTSLFVAEQLDAMSS